MRELYLAPMVLIYLFVLFPTVPGSVLFPNTVSGTLKGTVPKLN